MGVNSSMGVWAEGQRQAGVKGQSATAAEAPVRQVILTFGSSEHEAEALTVLLLQEHRLLLDDVVTEEEQRSTAESLPDNSLPASCSCDITTHSCNCSWMGGAQIKLQQQLPVTA